MKKHFILLAVSLSIALSACEREPASLSMAFAGDILLDRGVRARIERSGYESYYAGLKAEMPSADFLIGNLECPVTEIRAPVFKQYIFRGEVENLKYLRALGFTHLTLANNHSYDQGRAGLADTDKNLRENGLISLGYGIGHKAACAPVRIKKKGLRVAVFSSVLLPLENWAPLDNEPTACQAQPAQLAEQVATLKRREPATRIIVQLHWGVEHRPEPTIDQRQQARLLIDAGADVIVGHHPHVVQGMELYRGKPIVYSLGNFIFDQENEINRACQVLRLDVFEDRIDHRLIDYRIEATRPKR